MDNIEEAKREIYRQLKEVNKIERRAKADRSSLYKALSEYSTRKRLELKHLETTYKAILDDSLTMDQAVELIVELHGEDLKWWKDVKHIYVWNIKGMHSVIKAHNKHPVQISVLSFTGMRCSLKGAKTAHQLLSRLCSLVRVNDWARGIENRVRELERELSVLKLREQEDIARQPNETISQWSCRLISSGLTYEKVSKVVGRSKSSVVKYVNREKGDTK